MYAIRSYYAEGHFELLDAGVGFRVAHFAVSDFVELAQAVQLFAAQSGRDTVGIADEEDGIALTAEGDSRVFSYNFV